MLLRYSLPRFKVNLQDKNLILQCKSCQLYQVRNQQLRSLHRNIFKRLEGTSSQSLNITRRIHQEWSKWYSVVGSGDSSEKNPSDLKEDQPKPKKSKIDAIVKVLPKTKKQKEKNAKDLNEAFYDNILITPTRAMLELLLTPDDLKEIQTIKRRSPFPETQDLTVYLRKDVENKAIEKYGNLEKVQMLKDKEMKMKSRSSRIKSSREDLHGPLPPHYVEMMKKADKQDMYSTFSDGPGRVVASAIIINGVNCVMKCVAWMYTGSHSMFSEFLHSLADTANQLVLAFGIHQSLKKADQEHPYGWSNFRNVASLISGVGIFCIGSGLSFYHGIQGLLHPGHVQSLFWAIAILGGSFMSEGATLLIAVNQVKISSKANNLSFFEYVWRGEDPSTNVVLLEDFAAVVGVAIAASCMSMSYYWHTHIPDAVGSLLIGGLLATTATFIIYTNTVSLVGRSVHPIKKQQMMKDLESDRVVRLLHDVKATDIGGSFIRFKAEVDFDGTEVTRKYLSTQDTEQMLKEVSNFTTPEELENFMLHHGDKIVYELGSEVDRMEKNLKKRHPEVRHVDLEHL